MERTEIKKKMIECLQKFDGVDAPDDKVSETLFTIYGEEMNELCRMFEAEFRKLHQPTVSGQLPLDFVKWYSGMEQEKILKAYERWIRESGNLR